MEVKGNAEFPGPDGAVKIFVSGRTTMSKEGFGREPWIYPVTIVQSRYGGMNGEGGVWLAFPVNPHILDEEAWQDWAGSDIECMQWWDRQKDGGWPVGKGPSPNAAYWSLLKLAADGAGIELGGCFQEPTWDRDELRKRDPDA
jgi:hypothetical protein